MNSAVPPDVIQTGVVDFLLTLNLRWATLLLALIKLLRHSLSLINPGEVSDYPVEVPKSPWLLLYFFNNKVITELHTPCSPHVSPSCKLMNFLLLPWQLVFIFTCPKSFFKPFMVYFFFHITALKDTKLCSCRPLASLSAYFTHSVSLSC